MKKVDIYRRYIFLILSVSSMVLQGCGSHRLAEYHFPDYSAAAVITAPAWVEVHTGGYYGGHHGGYGNHKLISAAINLGTGIAKDVQAQQVKAKLDSALKITDIPQQVRKRIFLRSAEYLRFSTESDPRKADLLIDIVIKNYQLHAENWSGNVRFSMRIRTRIIDVKKGIEIWEESRERSLPVSSSFFGLPGAAGNILTMYRLSGLSTDQLVAGFRSLSEYTADKIIEELYDDYSDSRSGT